MSFLNWPTEEVLPSRPSQQHRRRVLSDLIRKFRRAFPEVTYELLWDSPTINAQAWRLGSARFVRVYGGLVRYPKMTSAGLALMLAHETGHHLGGPPYDPAMPWISWQGQADYWAASEGMKKVFGLRARGLTIRGVQEIYDLHKAFANGSHDREAELSRDCRREIFLAAAMGEALPKCAERALSQLYGEYSKY